MSVRREFLSGLLRIALSIEILFPFYIDVLARRSLGDLRKRGLISNYDVKTRRLKKFHYVVQIDLYKCGKKGGENS